MSNFAVTKLFNLSAKGLSVKQDTVIAVLAAPQDADELDGCNVPRQMEKPCSCPCCASPFAFL